MISCSLLACSTRKSGTKAGMVTLSGKLEKLGMSTFQYGTHTLTAEGRTYALKSSIQNLDSFVDKEVSVKGTKVEGYPVENGPELIDVDEVRVK